MVSGSVIFLYIFLICPLNMQLTAYLTRLEILPENTSLWSSGNTSSLVIRGPGLGNQSLPYKIKQKHDLGNQLVTSRITSVFQTEVLGEM